MKLIIEIKNKLLKTKGLNPDLKKAIESLGKNKNRPLGKFSPWAWWGEITRGCNLRCWHCATRLFPRNKFKHMKKRTWKNMIHLIKEVSPRTRLEIANAGEPTLHPNILNMLDYARRKCPSIQLMIYTNGTTLINGDITYNELFKAGLNMIQVNMYAPERDHIKLAKESGYFYYTETTKPKTFPGLFTYNKDQKFHAISLCKNPTNWLSKKKKQRNISTFMNHLDWKAANKHGVYPVTKAPNRRCDLPFKFIPTFYDGAYSFCCFDFMREMAGKLGNVNDGVEGFFKFWLGEYMQDTREKLLRKDRNSHKYCSTCKFTSVRCDIPYWKEGMTSMSWNGESLI